MNWGHLTARSVTLTTDSTFVVQPRAYMYDLAYGYNDEQFVC